nr:3-phosphoshikimate 1-carboxyvinyltransferase [Gammaproteobacteria bacterium]
LAAFRSMGVSIEHDGAGNVLVHGRGLHSLSAPADTLYLGNSGTAMRLMTGVLAGQQFSSVVSGDESLNGRPMGRIVKPLSAMGARIDTAADHRPPLKIHGGSVTGIDYSMPIASAQVKSCLLLAGLYAEGETRVHEPGITRDHTERMLRGFGYRVDSGEGWAALSGGGELTGTRIDVPADISSAAFFLVGASIAEGADITLKHVGLNPTRTGVIDILRLMGASIDLLNLREAGGEPVGDIRVRSSVLKGITVPRELVPLAIDEFPVLFVAAACAQGETVVEGAEELRVKESDRIQAMVDGLRILGTDIEGTSDGAVIRGGAIQGGQVDSLGDHRIAMAFAIAGLRCEKQIVVTDCDNVDTSFPGFAGLADSVGLRIEVN